jgi:hypothetical protein
MSNLGVAGCTVIMIYSFYLVFKCFQSYLEDRRNK